jgi:D-glycero-alpha-D-manno-heptose 1-phosphate guanylyltransferase
MSEVRDTKAVLLVGGLGTRLRSVVQRVPKVLAPVGNHSFLELIVRQLRSQGVHHLVFCTGYLSGQIEEKFGDGKAWDISIEYSKESKALGTAGAIKLAQPLLRDVPYFLVMNGDSFLEINFSNLMDFHQAHRAVVTMAVRRVEDTSRYGRVDIDSSGRVKSFSEKIDSSAPGLVNGGVYVFDNSVFNLITEQQTASLEKDVFPQLLNRGLYAREQRGIFIDIGTPPDYARAQTLYAVLDEAAWSQSE